MSTDLTLATVQRLMPPNLRSAVTQDYIDRINTITTDPVARDAIKENFLSYTRVMAEGKFKTDDYLNAVSYISYRLMGDNQQEAYIRTFPDRYQQMLANGYTAKNISAVTSAYDKGKLVNLIREQTLVPSWVLNADIYQKAINTQAELMANATSELVRTQAANSILTHLAKPKEVGPLVNLNLGDSSGMNELKDTLAQLARQQQALIASGVSPRDVAAQPLVQRPVDEDVTDV